MSNIVEVDLLTSAKRAAAISLASGNEILRLLSVLIIATDTFHPTIQPHYVNSTISVVNDCDDLGIKSEVANGVLVGLSYFTGCVNTIDDIRGLFLHNALHLVCDEMWKKCTVNMSQFQLDWLDIGEEIYNQSIVHYYHPTMAALFPSLLCEYNLYRGRSDTKEFRSMHKLMFPPHKDHPDLTHGIQIIHQWLYSQDPLNQDTFTQYWRMWECINQRDLLISEYIAQTLH